MQERLLSPLSYDDKELEFRNRYNEIDGLSKNNR